LKLGASAGSHAAATQLKAVSVGRHGVEVRSFLKGVVFVAGLFSLAFVCLLWYLYLTYIDEAVVTGSAYGYTIGQSKRDVYEIATHQFRDNEISGIHIMEPFETFDPSPGNFAMVESGDLWTVFPAERNDFFDTVDLHFEDGALTKVHRHRQRFELP
jgi:hypothetical protein